MLYICIDKIYFFNLFLNLIKIMKTLFDYNFDKEDFTQFSNILQFGLDHSEDEQKKRFLFNLLDYLSHNLNMLVKYNMDSIHIGFSKEELDAVVCSVRDYNPLEFLPEDLLQIKCDCFDTLLSTYFFID